jgi:hypothetical protein
MTMRIVLSAIGGAVIGGAILVIVLIGSVAFAWATGTRAYLPGVFDAWITEENGMPAVNFVPNPWGMLAVVVVISAGFVWTAVRKHR